MDNKASPMSVKTSINKKDGLLFLKSIFFKSNDVDDEAASASQNNSPKPLSILSPIANSVISRCSKILQKPTEELQHCFDTEHTDTVKQPLIYARGLLEFCSYKALHLVTGRPNYLVDKDFSQLTFDMMLAWEGPGAENEPLDSEFQD